MLNKEISEVEKGCGELVEFWDVPCGCFEDLKHSDHYIYCLLCQEKLSTLKSAQAKFDKFVEEEKRWLIALQHDIKHCENYKNDLYPCEGYELREWIIKHIDELSSKEGKDGS